MENNSSSEKLKVVLSAMDLLKTEIICHFCNDVASDPVKFVKCSHIYCAKHIKEERISKCLSCHRRNDSQIIKADDIHHIIQEYNELNIIFSEILTKSNETQVIESDKKSDNIHGAEPNVKRSKRIKKPKKPFGESSSDVLPLSTEPSAAPGIKRVLRKKISKDINVEKASNKCVITAVKDNIVLEEKSNLVVKAKTIGSNSKNVKSSKENESQKSDPKLNERSTEALIKKKAKELNDSLLKKSLNESVSDISVTGARDVNKRNKKGETRLHTACTRGREDEVKALLTAGVSPNTVDHAGWTPLHEVVAVGSSTLVQLLLSHGALSSVPGPHYETPLHEAVRSSRTDVVTLLLQAGANVHARNDKGITPLDVASKELKLLLQEKQSSKFDAETLKHATKPLRFTDPFVLYISSDMKRFLSKAQKLTSHKDLKIVSEFNKNVSHVLVEPIEENICRLNQDSLLATVSGKALLSSDWLLHCDGDKLANPEEFLITSVGGKLESARLSLESKRRLEPRLFSGCHFYFVGFGSKYEISAHLIVKKQFLCKVVEEGGGVVLKREPDPEAIPENEKIIPYHAPPDGVLARCAHYIVYQTKPQLAYNMEHIKSLPVGWLIECVANFKLVNP